MFVYNVQIYTIKKNHYIPLRQTLIHIYDTIVSYLKGEY